MFVVQGTTFVLQKKTEPRQRLLSAISTGTGVREVNMANQFFFIADLVSLYQVPTFHFISFPITLQAIDELISLHQNLNRDETQLQEGEWQMLWSSQVVFSS